MANKMSPSYLMKLINSIEKKIRELYPYSIDTKFYIEKWYEYDPNGYWENFPIVMQQDNNFIDLAKTLHGIDGEMLLKIAIDLGIETPDFIPSIPTFRNEIKSSYPTASATFEKAFHDIDSHPEIAIGLANSALESIVKHILIGFKPKGYSEKDTLYKQTTNLLKEFSLYPNADLPDEIKQIGSAMLSMNQAIEKLRSEKTSMHGKGADEYVVNDVLYAYFVVNSVATIGLFLKSFYEQKHSKLKQKLGFDDFDDEIPF
jgi:hypothetical protein